MKPLISMMALFLSGIFAVGDTYSAEAPLPAGWPNPGPYDEVAEKSYPEYRVAVTKGAGSFSFWRLFRHIKSEKIPMTAPVEMTVKEDGKKADMGFLYQNTEVGETGKPSKKIEIKDVPKAKALSYAWMGRDSKAAKKKAKAALDAALEAKGIAAVSFRMLGYNGPGTPRDERTYELQAILPAE